MTKPLTDEQLREISFDVTRGVGGLHSAALLHEVERLKEENAQLREVCAQAYQICGNRGMGEKMLDNLSAASNGGPIPHSEISGEDYKWKWLKCGHISSSDCSECFDQLRSELAVAQQRAELADRKAKALDWLDRKDRSAHQNEKRWSIWLDTSRDNEPITTEGSLLGAIESAVAQEGGK